jgi:hypothetical protein
MKHSRILLVLQNGLLALLLLAALASVVRIVTKDSSVGQIDFYSYWYAGHAVRLGADPYQVWSEGRALRGDFTYLDGSTAPLQTPSGVQMPSIGVPTPANTAPVVLLLAPFAWLTWPAATLAWSLCNVVLGFVCVYLALRLAGERLRTRRGLLMLGMFFTLVAFREVLELGQTTLLVFACMLGAFALARRRPFLAGLLLGIALSKYSLIFPAVLILLYQRRWRVLLWAAAVQAAGLLLIAAIGRSSPVEIVINYWRILVMHTGADGMHLAAGLLRNTGWFGALVVVLLSAGLFALLAVWHSRRATDPEPQGYALDRATYLLLAILMIWNLLAFYHRRYDNVVILLYLIVLIPPATAALREQAVRWALLIGQWLVWSLPIYSVAGPYLYIVIFESANLVALAASLWLLFRLAPAGKQLALGRP